MMSGGPINQRGTGLQPYKPLYWSAAGLHQELYSTTNVGNMAVKFTMADNS